MAGSPSARTAITSTPASCRRRAATSPSPPLLPLPQNTAAAFRPGTRAISSRAAAVPAFSIMRRYGSPAASARRSSSFIWAVVTSFIVSSLPAGRGPGVFINSIAYMVALRLLSVILKENKAEVRADEKPVGGGRGLHKAGGLAGPGRVEVLHGALGLLLGLAVPRRWRKKRRAGAQRLLFAATCIPQAAKFPALAVRRTQGRRQNRNASHFAAKNEEDAPGAALL